ncbi:hypothetical protein ASE08_29070 [Rhizobacter sp. Root16D2]|nr:hypothetical protein ASC88_07005 [Rhizobacter sp. Root29]KQW13029.1 hypothetical protein ASC98_18505 [Rhizobacter sp. Root1238]KRB10881.1 hypothetical protein ASE08_29070 [Rhizobacter sp. Root16D2]
MQTIKVLPVGAPWPGIGYVESALLAISEVDLQERISTKLARGTEDGLGSWAAVGLRLPSGGIVELVNYHERPGQNAFIVRTVATAAPELVLDELLSCLGLTQPSVIWRWGDSTA